MPTSCVFDGPIQGEALLTCVEPAHLEIPRPGDILILGKLASRTGRNTRGPIRQSGSGVWFLPLYSPDPNPIEKALPEINRP
ncbi:MAG: hypothetical protein GVY06_06785 [Alphaproteobacteria bacterium]|jgi:transposase|nr:hypothetical protein [Alphaproteobacteria bacterium]